MVDAGRDGGGALGLVVLDETVVGVALPTMQRDLDMSQVTSHWVINAYLLVFTGLAAAGGKLGDIVDIRRLFVAGVAVFGLASLASGFAQHSAWLITGRAIQGIGAAVIFPTSVAMITNVFPLEQRGLAFGIHTGVGGTFLALGPLVGGFFTEVLSWRWIFWINLPVVVGVVLITMAAWVTSPREGRSVPIDYPGLISLVVGLSALVTGLMQGAEWGWSDPVTRVLLAGGAAILLVFVLVEARVASPLVEIALFRNATFTGTNLSRNDPSRLVTEKCKVKK